MQGYLRKVADIPLVASKLFVKAGVLLRKSGFNLVVGSGSYLKSPV